MDHRNSISELREGLAEMRLRVRLDPKDDYAKDRVLALSFYLADKLFFRRLWALKAAGKPTVGDRLLGKLGKRLERTLGRVT